MILMLWITHIQTHSVNLRLDIYRRSLTYSGLLLTGIHTVRFDLNIHFVMFAFTQRYYPHYFPSRIIMFLIDCQCAWQMALARLLFNKLWLGKNFPHKWKHCRHMIWNNDPSNFGHTAMWLIFACEPKQVFTTTLSNHNHDWSQRSTISRYPSIQNGVSFCTTRQPRRIFEKLYVV